MKNKLGSFQLVYSGIEFELIIIFIDREFCCLLFTNDLCKLSELSTNSVLSTSLELKKIHKHRELMRKDDDNIQLT